MAIEMALALHLKMKPHVGCLTGNSESSEAIAFAVNAARLHGSAQLFSNHRGKNLVRPELETCLLRIQNAEAVIRAMQVSEDEFEVKITEFDDLIRLDITCKK
jgi:hypothetical protein